MDLLAFTPEEAVSLPYLKGLPVLGAYRRGDWSLAGEAMPPAPAVLVALRPLAKPFSKIGLSGSCVLGHSPAATWV